MLAFRCRIGDPNQLILGIFARTFRLGVDFGAQGGLSRQLKTSIFLVRGVQNRSLSDLESKRFEDRIWKGFEAAKSSKKQQKGGLGWMDLGGSAAWRGAV